MDQGVTAWNYVICYRLEDKRGLRASIPNLQALILFGIFAFLAVEPLQIALCLIQPARGTALQSLKANA